jgi:hypothetical protein
MLQLNGISRAKRKFRINRLKSDLYFILCDCCRKLLFSLLFLQVSVVLNAFKKERCGQINFC